MRWSWRIGSYAGIGVYVHATFLLLLAWIGVVHWIQGEGLAGILGGIVFILALFACVVLHEFGHALTARRFGIRTRDITLLPIGGVSRMERMPEEPRQELWLALAGPAVNVAIAALLLAGLVLAHGLAPLRTLGVASGSFWERLLVVNVFLALFNVLPAFPMDGGRVLRALLAMRMDYTRATEVAARLGQGIALLFGFLGLLWNPFLVFIAFFVWIGAAQESSMALMRSALAGIPVERAMLTDFKTLSPSDTLGRAVELVLAGSQHDFPVVDGGRIAGVLRREDLLRGLHEAGRDSRVGDAMRCDFQTADSSEMLETAFARLQGCDCRVLPVTRGGALAGLLTPDNVGELLAIRSALGEGSRGAGEGLLAASR